MSKNGGGPAFPVPLPHKAPFQEHGRKGSGGMTLRDYFAGQALAGWFAMFDRDTFDWDVSHVVSQCYEHADAMLAERDKT